MSKNNRHCHHKSKNNPNNFSAQHRLINKRLVLDLLDLARIQRNETVLDLGAGTGAITFPLAERAANVIAIETDPEYVSKLRSRAEAEHMQNVRVVPADILQIQLPRREFVVVANIPYSITTAILGKLLDHPAVPLQRAVLLVELGAAKRFTGRLVRNPRMLGWRMGYEFQLVRSVAPSNFSPPPKVDSAILVLRRRKDPLVPPKHHARFMALAAHAFRYPELPLPEALSGVFTPPQTTRLLRQLGVDRGFPVSRLDEAGWGQLFSAMLKHVPPERWPRTPQPGSGKPKKRR